MQLRSKAALLGGIALGLAALAVIAVDLGGGAVKPPVRIEGDRSPGAEDPDTPLDEADRRAARSTSSSRRLAVLVQEEPNGPRLPLGSGRAKVTDGSQVLALPIVDGSVALPADWRGYEGCEVLSVEDGSGEQFLSCMDGDSSTLRCYGYPGVFVQVEDQETPSSPRALQAAEFSGDVNISSAFRIPPSDQHVSQLGVDGTSPAFVEAASPGNSFYMLRPQGCAWQRIETRDAPVGSTIVIPATPSGSVSFYATTSAFAQTPRLVVRSAAGDVVMRPRFTSDVQQATDGWPVGEYEAFLTFASTDSPEYAVSERTQFRVLRGQGTHVVIDTPEDSGAHETGHLVGILHFEAWELVEPWYQQYGLRLTIEPLQGVSRAAFNSILRRDRILPTQQMEPLPTQPSGSPAWRWDAGKYPVGEYRVCIEPIRAWIHFSVQAGETTVLDEAVPMMAVTVLFVFGGGSSKQDLAPLLSYPKEWTSYPKQNDASRLLEGDEGARMMITQPGEYSLGFLWGTKWIERELLLQPGWNSAYFNPGETATATLVLVDENGTPLALERLDWKRLAVRSKSSGESVTVIPMHVRVKGMGSWSQAKIDVSHGESIVIEGLSELGFAADRTEVDLPGGETRRLQRK